MHRPYDYNRGPEPAFTRNNPSEKAWDVGVYPKNVKWLKSVVGAAVKTILTNLLLVSYDKRLF